MATNITSTALDFNNIKNKLKTYLAAQPEFADYDFEASGLSNILDVLAYNTHFNGLIANFAINESFLNTSQLRSSVVSHAETLGYRPRSKIGATSILGVYANLTGVAERPATIELPIGTTFSGDTDDASYTFRTRVRYTASDDGNGIYTFVDDNSESKILVYEGTPKTKTFYADYIAENQVYVIPDANIDTNTIEVRVYQSASSEIYESYYNISTAIAVETSSRYFDVIEAPNGQYEINFGDGTSFGRKPDVGNKIVISYMATAGSLGNTASGFTAQDQIEVNSVSYNLYVNTQTVSGGGADKESIESIRKLAPIQFAAQKRLVTSLDYKGMVLSNFPVINDVAVWGGEDNIPVDYGKVFISLQFNDGVSEEIKTLTRSQIQNNFTDNLSVMSISNEFVDPVNSYLELDTRFYFDPDLTGSTASSLESLVRSYILNYFSTNLSTFNTVFRRSNLLTEIDDLEPSILSSRMDINIQQRFTPALGLSNYYEIYFPILLSAPSSTDYVIESSAFRYNNYSCRFRNKIGTNRLEMFIGGTSTILIDNIGYYDYKKGLVVLEAFNPQAIIGGTSYIKITAKPLDESAITPLRNYIFNIDTSKLFVKGVKSPQTTRITL